MLIEFSRETNLVGSELCVVQLSDGILHVLLILVFHNPSAILYISEADVTCLSHVIFQVLPATRWWQTCQNNSLWLEVQNHYV